MFFLVPIVKNQPRSMSFWSYVARNGNYDLLGVQMHKKGPKRDKRGVKGGPRAL